MGTGAWTKLQNDELRNLYSSAKGGKMKEHGIGGHVTKWVGLHE